MAFFTSVKAEVPLLGNEEGDLTLESCSSTLREKDLVSEHESIREDEGTLKEGLSTETVNTIIEDADQGGMDSSSQNSTPTPGAPGITTHRFSYEVDPELGAFV